MNFRVLWAEWRPWIIQISIGLLILFAVAAVLVFLPSGTAAILLGFVAAAAAYYFLLRTSSRLTRVAVMWSAITISADAAYAKLNDQTPITLANALTKCVDALVKLADTVIKNSGPRTADLKVKIGAVTPDFVWAFIILLALTLWWSLSLRRSE